MPLLPGWGHSRVAGRCAAMGGATKHAARLGYPAPLGASSKGNDGVSVHAPGSWREARTRKTRLGPLVDSAGVLRALALLVPLALWWI